MALRRGAHLRDLLRVVVALTLISRGRLLGQRVDRTTCARVPTSTAATRTAGDNGFAVKILGDTPVEYYEPGKTYTISVNSSYPNQAFLDFMLVAVPRGARDEKRTLGSWKLVSGPARLIKTDDHCEHILTSAVFHTSFKKPGVSTQWVAPAAGSGCVEFRATVLEHADIWYKDDGGLTRVLCEKPPSAARTAAAGATAAKSTPTSNGGAGGSAARAAAPAQCCACGSAKYEMTFYGNWTPESHPKDYPSGPYAGLLHWSNIVGASHSKAYSMWAYGELATNGVKEVCEFGWPKALEAEIKNKGSSIRTVIKTNGVWGADAMLKETRSARFSTDKQRHLLSLITMIGPSPDWCIGLSAVDLCLPDCRWQPELVAQLYPWDAGTDSGITYMSDNAPTHPRQRISPLTNSQPDNAASPFHGSSPVKPFATVVVKRLDEPHGPEQCDTDSLGGGPDGGDEGADDSGPDPKCMLTEWSEFSDCSATCGIGIKTRLRAFKNPMATVHMCPPGITLHESEHCLGVVNECVEDETGSHDPIACATAPYSAWSPCSVTCGQGLRTRTRQYKDVVAAAACNKTLVQTEGCTAKEPDCSKAEAMKDWEAICRLPKDEGRCRALFPRWYYDYRMKKCLPFNFGGCRGNENQFLTMADCDARCSRALSREQVDCMVTPWSEWSECSLTCRGEGIDGKQMRSRMIKVPSANGGTPCPDDLSEAQPCYGADTLPRCAVGWPLSGGRGADCMMSPWSDWSECSSQCGLGNMTRQRMIKQPAQPGGLPCPADLVATKICFATRCNVVDCMVTPWSDWSQCSATCGMGKTMRQRMVKVPAANGGTPCPADLVEADVCTAASSCPERVDCMMTPWGEWSQCSVQCDLGEQSRSRMVKLPASGGGSPCPDGLLEKRVCLLRECSTRAKARATKTTTAAAAAATTTVAVPSGEEPVDCVVTDWTSWTPCSRSCGGGKQMKARIVSVRAKNGGRKCPRLKETRSCSEQPCPGSGGRQRRAA